MEFNNSRMNKDNWTAPMIPDNIPQGDITGETVKIVAGHIEKANIIFPQLLDLLKPLWEQDERRKVVVAVCGGSGVGKSGIASVLSFYFRQIGIGSYIMSGDNYPHRIPKYNDAERLRVFRESAIKGMVKEGIFTKDRFEIIHEIQKAEDDANPIYIKQYEWYESYLQNGRKGLESYLGTTREIGFDEVESIIGQFKNGSDKIWLRRMGREDTELWYEEVDFSQIRILIIEWTHGNSDNYKGVDIPIFLNSTPQETLTYRKSRNRDGATDSPFTTMVLEIEQRLLGKQAHKAKIIVSKSGKVLSYDEYLKVIEESKKQ